MHYPILLEMNAGSGEEPMEEPGPVDVPPRFVQPYVRILEALCGADDFHVAARALVEEISQTTGCEAVSLRVHDRKDDYPYFVYSGFDKSFVEKESSLCERDPDGRVVRGNGGLSALECMCGSVLRGMTDPGQPFFTEHGSFWTNSTTDLLSGTTDGDRGTKTRNMCNAFGYESVALVPMRAGNRIVGLIQTNSRERGRFDPPAMDFLERIAHHTGSAIETAWHREELDRLSKEFEVRRRGVETMVALGEMTATLAHEVKNPLAGMMLSATRLRKALRGQEKLESIAEHLCTAINALSETVTRVGRSVREPKLERTEIDAGEVLESAVSLVAPRAAEQGVTIIRDVAEELPKVSADAHFLMRAFLNLLVNALDVMPSAGMLHLATKVSDSGEVEVVIGDTGPGVKPDEVESFFRPFETSKPGGTGLGLGIVRRIVELHSGTVTLRPRPGGGTEAAVTLPVADGKARRAEVPSP